MFNAKTSIPWTISRVARYASAIVLSITLVILGFNAIRKNDEGYRQVRMNPLTGNLVVREKAGLYINGIYQVKTYQWETSYTFSNDPNDQNTIGKAIKVRFNDGGLADISGDFRFKLPTDEYSMIRIHETFGTPAALMEQLYMQAVKGAVYSTSQLMSSEEAYTQKARYSQLVSEQLQDGIYKTEEYIEYYRNDEGEQEHRKRVRIMRDKNAVPLRNEPVLREFGIEITQGVIREPEYEGAIVALIDKKRKFEVDINVAIADVEKAQQEKRTAIAEGNKDVTTARYQAEKAKIKAVAEADKDKTVKLTRANEQLLSAQQEFNEARSWADGRIALAKGEAQRRRDVLAADNALEKRLAAYTEIMPMVIRAWQKKRWTAEIANTEAGIVSENNLPVPVESLFELENRVRADLGLEQLKF